MLKIGLDKKSFYMYTMDMENKEKRNADGVKALKDIAVFLECDWRELEAALKYLVARGK